MSSPSSSGASTKRKRTSFVPPNRLKSSTAGLLQPSSRDASGEELADSSPASNTRHRNHAQSVDSNGVPPTKRPRTRASAAALDATPKSNGALDDLPTIATQDPGEPSPTTEGSADTENESKRGRGRPSKSNSHENVATQRIKEPQKAGLQDPVGYHTNPPPVGRSVRVYADGVFDLFHLGLVVLFPLLRCATPHKGAHMRQLEQAKTAFPDTYLLVGVTGDAETHKRKGLTVLTGAERAETVRHCKWVDEVLPGCPWIVTPEFLEKHSIDYVAHDDEPYGADEGDDIYKPIKEQGKFLVTQRTEGVSTTGIITKIVRDYEKYIARQFKRGASRQELNVSWLKKNELDLRRHVTELRDSIRSNWTSTGSEIGKDLRQFWQASRPASPAPGARSYGGQTEDVPRSPSGSALEKLTHLDIPASGQSGRMESPGRAARSEDFATGYSLGLIGGVRSWMMRSRNSLRDSQPNSPTGSEEEDDDDSARDPVRAHEEKSVIRGRKGESSSTAAGDNEE